MFRDGLGNNIDVGLDRLQIRAMQVTKVCERHWIADNTIYSLIQGNDLQRPNAHLMLVSLST